MTGRGAIAAAIALSIALFLAGLSVQLRAQSAPAADTKIWDGVYTPGQAARGKAVYEAYCTRCHGIDMVGGRQTNGGGPALAGPSFWLTWERAPLASVFSKISKTMPLDSPGSLRIDDYADLLAYILAGNTFPAGTVEVPPTGAGLDAVRIVRKAGEGGEAANFSLVQVVGCLSSGGGASWQLARSTAPVITRDETPTESALREAAESPLGSDTVRLISVSQYGLESKVGRRIEARGLLNRLPGETRLDVLSLHVVGAACGS